PDGDGLNDNFKVVGEGLDLSNFKMTVFNKWGELVFESNNPDIGWDGTRNGSLVPDGVYIWKIDAKEAHSPIILNKDGFITIVR
ncbi:MAG: gliding motility-associated C-terminal domain-containing protein, partial [Flavobacteriales bacterium]